MSESSSNQPPVDQSKSKEEIAKERELRKKQKEAEKLAKKEARETRNKDREAPKAAADLTWAEVDQKTFGNYPLLQSHSGDHALKHQFTPVSSLVESSVGQSVWLRARIHSSRKASNKLAFLLLRDGAYSVQCVIAVDDNEVSRDLLKFATGLSIESIVDIYGTVTKPEKRVEKASQHDVEVFIKKIFCLSHALPKLPLLVEDAARPLKAGEDDDDETKPVNNNNNDVNNNNVTDEHGKEMIAVKQSTRLDNRVLDMRAPAHVAIFKLASAMQHLFREFLVNNDFTEIHTPKLIGTASEGGANVFSVKYFDGTAYLAQSPQLYKQMAVMGDLMRVFEIGPVFRAENHNTYRHLTEFVGLDLEMRFQNHYHEVVKVILDLFVYIFENVEKRYGHLIQTISQQYEVTPLKYSPALHLTYSEGIKMLQEKGVKITDNEDLSTEQEKFLGQLVKEKYGTDFYLLDKYPLCARPFYTMPDPENPKFSNSYDAFIRGNEVLSGAQRIHDPDLLLKRASDLKIATAPLEHYINSFKYGAWPHAGCGIGMERLVMLYLGIGNVRRTSMFPRDPQRLFP